MFKLLYRKFIRDNACQILLKSTGFCWTYDKIILVCFFGSQCIYNTKTRVITAKAGITYDGERALSVFDFGVKRIMSTLYLLLISRSCRRLIHWRPTTTSNYRQPTCWNRPWSVCHVTNLSRDTVSVTNVTSVKTSAWYLDRVN